MNVETYTVGKTSIQRSKDFDGDERGLIWLWEPPKPNANYVMGIDPSVGRTGWCRATRTADDYRTDNGAIEVIRCGRPEEPDVQVAEYAAPVDAEDIGVVAAALGRLFAGCDENGALAIIEMYPGPGLLTYRKMVSDFGYTNHFVWKYLDTISPTPNRFGFWPGRDANKYLWIRASRHIHGGGFIPHSPWLVEEMRNCEVDPTKMWGRAVYGTHDDRVRAMMMALWAAHDWTMQVDTAPPKVLVDAREPSWQASDISVDTMYERWEEKFAEMSE